MADALSRICLIAWSEPRAQFLTDLRCALQLDPHLSVVIQQCLDHSNLDPTTVSEKGYYIGRIVWLFLPPVH